MSAVQIPICGASGCTNAADVVIDHSDHGERVVCEWCADGFEIVREVSVITTRQRPGRRAAMTGGSDEMETRVGHCKADETDVYVGRGPGGRDMLETPIGRRGWLGNPHTVDDHGREGSIERFRRAFEHRLATDEQFRDAVADLAGQTLGCWCQRLDEEEPACHGEVIAEYASWLASEPSPTDELEGDA